MEGFDSAGDSQHFNHGYGFIRARHLALAENDNDPALHIIRWHRNRMRDCHGGAAQSTL